MKGLHIRPWADGDGYEELTNLLHRAYAPLAAMGLRYVATRQDVETTRRRCEEGHCLVAQLGGRLIGTVTVYRPEPDDACAYYRTEGVMVFGQFGVEPSFQGMGIGTALYLAAEDHARAHGARTLALDTAKPAQHLIALYERWGFRQVGSVNWRSTNYESVIMAKDLAQ